MFKLKNILLFYCYSTNYPTVILTAEVYPYNRPIRLP